MLFGLLKADLFTGEVKHFDQKPDPNPVKGFEWRAFRQGPAPAFNPATHRLSDEVFTVNPTLIVASRTIIALTQTELDNVDKSKIVGAGIDLGFIVIKLVDKLIAKNVITPADLDTDTRREYLDLKAIITRLRP